MLRTSGRKLTTITGSYRGIVRSIKKLKYYTTALITCVSNDGTESSDISFKIFDSVGDIFKSCIQVGDEVEGQCVCNAINSKGRRYNKIKTFQLVQRNKVNTPCNISNTYKVFMMEGVITNISNRRDKKGKDGQVCFCFKSVDRRRVDYVKASDIITKSTFFKKGSKIVIEVIEEPRTVTTNNRTLRLINMWSRV